MQQEWRVPRGIPGLKLAGAAILGVTPVFTTDRQWLLLAGAAAAALAVWGLRDLLVPLRLAADGAGLTVVAGFAGRRHIAWSEVEDIRVGISRRAGLRTELLEIDTGEKLCLFNAHELGAPCPEVLTALRSLRAESR